MKSRKTKRIPLAGTFGRRPGAHIGRKHIPIIRRELLKLERRAGAITPQAVVEVASDPEHPLHRFFQWDDEIAAQQYRLWQARQIIRSVVIVTQETEDGTEKFVPAFVNIKAEADEERFDRQAYVSTATALQGQYRKQILQRAHREAVWWKNRYAYLAEFSEIVNAIDRVKIAA